MKRSLVFAAIAVLATACTGPRGYDGPTGATGAQGSTGLTGSQGQPGATVTETTTSSSGTLTELTPGALVIKSATAPEPLPYTSTRTTTYVDQNGNAVAMSTVKSGDPVTVYYTRSADGLVASKVVVNRSVTTDSSGSTIEKHTTVTTP